MKRTSLPRVSKRRPEKRALAARLYEDCHGVRFGETELYVPTRRMRPVTDEFALDLYRAMHHGGYESVTVCMLPRCANAGTDPHHIIGGASRSHEFTNLIWLCRACHDAVQGDQSRLAEVLLAKWRHEREQVNWVRLRVLRGKALPDLE